MKRSIIPLFLVAAVAFSTSCSINRLAVRAAADALSGTSSSGSNGNIFTRDEDPELVADALPMLMKLSEALLDADPENDSLMVTVGSLFVMYANAFVEGPTFYYDTDKYLEKKSAIERAKKLYIRGTRYLRPVFERRYPGFWKSMDNSKYGEALAKCKKNDISAMYWYAAGSMAAFALAPTDLDVSMELPGAFEMLLRAKELDEPWNGGSLLDILTTFYASMPEELGGSADKAKETWKKYAVAAGAISIGPKMSKALNFILKDQDSDPAKLKSEFIEIMKECAEADIEADPANRLMTVLAKRRAARYLKIVDTLF